jgi:hypothetical protein
MQRRKILAACLSLFLVALALPALRIPNANAFTNNNSAVTIAGIAITTFDSYFHNTQVDAVAAGSVLNFNVYVQASNCGSQCNYQRNVTVGVKFDWMTNYQNASNASPTSTFPMTANQQAVIQVPVSIPSLTGTNANANLYTHTWTVVIWDGTLNSLNAINVNTNCADTEKTPSCVRIDMGFGNHPIAIYNPDQLAGMQARKQASTQLASLSTTLGSLTQLPPGAAGAIAALTQASNEMSLGDQSYSTGDFASARTHYQNSQNNVNTAISSLSGTGGGVDTANLTHSILDGAGIVMVGIGALFAGLGAFAYFRKKPKA